MLDQVVRVSPGDRTGKTVWHGRHKWDEFIGSCWSVHSCSSVRRAKSIAQSEHSAHFGPAGSGNPGCTGRSGAFGPSSPLVWADRFGRSRFDSVIRCSGRVVWSVMCVRSGYSGGLKTSLAHSTDQQFTFEPSCLMNTRCCLNYPAVATVVPSTTSNKGSCLMQPILQYR